MVSAWFKKQFVSGWELRIERMNTRKGNGADGIGEKTVEGGPVLVGIIRGIRCGEKGSNGLLEAWAFP